VSSQEKILAVLRDLGLPVVAGSGVGGRS